MRLGGPFPFNPAGSFPVSLGGGQYFYIPPGNWLVSTGGQSVIQWWDPVLSTWRNICPAPTPGAALSTDGYNYRLINMSGVVQGAAITNAGSGGVNGIGPTQTGTSVSFAAPGGNGQTAKGYAIIGGSLPALSIAQAGSGFVVPPLILIDQPPLGGIQATAVATITAAGALASVTLVNPGAGYTVLPNVYVIPQFLDYPGQLALPYTVPVSPTPIAPNFPPGQIAIGPGGTSFAGVIPQNFAQGLQASSPSTAGALVTFGAGVLAGSGTLTGLVVFDYGSGYSTVPAITFAGGTLAGGVAATSLMSWALVSATQTAGAAFTVGNPIKSTLGYFFSGANAQRIVNNDYMQPREVSGVVTNANGAFNIEDPGFGFQIALTSPNLGEVVNGTTAPTTAGTYTIVMGGINDTSLLQAFVNE
ncbi:MAG TPA: hypothetical protein VN325_23345 [Steroidobacteraceae bacterium]|nr:hypothetical protein [Steroidobacteraceae bacterium]